MQFLIYWVLPTLIQNQDAKAALKIFIGTGRDLTSDDFYTVTIGLTSGTAIGKLSGSDRCSFLETILDMFDQGTVLLILKGEVSVTSSYLLL